MAFPQTPLDVRADLKIDGVWQDVTADVFTRNVITIARGRRDEGARTDPGKTTLTFNNGRSKINPAIRGRYSDGNPRSDLYGKIGRNTPVRIHVPASQAHLSMDGDVTGYVETPHTAALNITGDIDVRVEFDADLTDAARNSVLIGKWASALTDRAWALRFYGGNFIFSWSDAGGSPFQITMPGGYYGGAAVRVTLDVDNGAGGWTMRWYQADSIDGPWTQIYPDVVFAGVMAIQATTSPLRIGAPDATTAPPRQPFIGTATRLQVRSGIDGTLVADADFRALADGAPSFTDSVGRTWTVNGTAKVRKRADRFVGEISSWPPRWDVSGQDRWVPVEAAGVLRRYGQGAQALASTLRRRIPSGLPDAYWPMEEGSGATQAYSPISGVSPLKVSGLQFASVDTLPGSSPLPALGAASSIVGTVPGGSATGWHVEMVYRLEQLPATQREILRVRVTGSTMAYASVLVGTAGIRIEARDVDDNLIVFVNYSDPDALAAFTGTWNRLQFYTGLSGGTTNLLVSWRRTDGVAPYWFARTIYTGTPGRAFQTVGTWGSDLQGMALGHLAVWNGVAASTTSPYPAAIKTYESADDGFLGESAGWRMLRLAVEENIPLSLRGVIPQQQAMGSQRPNTLLELLGECADSDGGILLEHRGRPALRYRGRATLYNQTPALTLNYAARGEIAPPLEPVVDDADVVNDVTVSRVDGSSARVVQADGPLSVQAPPNGIGRYDTSVQRSLAADAQAEPLAGWLLHLGTWNAPRYPTVHINLAAAPYLADAVLAVDQGDVIRLTNLPEDLPPGDVDLIVQGTVEEFDQYAWDVYLNCTPAEPWRVAGLAVWEDFEDSVYEVTAADGGNLPWTRSQLHYNNGTWSLRSGAITNNQTSDWVVTIPPGSTQMRFWYWTSTEASGPGFEGDRLLVLVDGVQVLRAQGTTPWTQAIVDVTGKRLVTFRYIKDNSTAVGEDAVHIDDLSFTGIPPVRLDTDGSELATAVTSTATALTVATTPLDAPLWTRNLAEFPFDIRAGGEVMRVLAVTSWCTDTFTRTVAGGWGNADTGQTWGVVGGTVATDYAVGSGYGQHTLTSVNASRRCGVPFTYPDADVVVDVTTSVAATGGSLYGGPLVRYVDADNLYMLRVEFTTAGAILLDLRKRAAATESSIATYTTGLTHTPGTFVRARLQARGSVLRAKVWAPGTPEPDWQITATDTSVAGSNFVGCRSIAAASNTNTSPQIRYDGFEVFNPQSMTVTRSVNGITKAQTAGTKVALAYPMIAAL
ncbi:hypothetical protein ACFY7A_30140 [Streptomyces longwoodensis]|uniref:hypothetical protein n=1 Tax=Streptomyces longwoodensis TaxID=68231 RepID=UPI0036CC7F80